MARKTKEEALETRNAILDAAELVFHERGVSATSLAEIAEAAGVTRGAIYWHFVNKEALYDAMIQRVFAPVEAKFAELTQDTDANPIEILRQIALFVVGRVTPSTSMVSAVYATEACWLRTAEPSGRKRRRRPRVGDSTR